MNNNEMYKELEQFFANSERTSIHPEQVGDITEGQTLGDRIRQIEHMQAPVDTFANLPTVTIDGAICLVKDDHIFHQYVLEIGTWIPLSSVNVRGISYFIQGEIQVDDNIVTFLVPNNLTLKNIKLYIGQAPLGLDLIVNISHNNTAIFNIDKPTILDGQTSGELMIPDIQAVAGDRLSLNVEQIGSTFTGMDLSVLITAEES